MVGRKAGWDVGSCCEFDVGGGSFIAQPYPGIQNAVFCNVHKRNILVKNQIHTYIHTYIYTCIHTYLKRQTFFEKLEDSSLCLHDLLNLSVCMYIYICVCMYVFKYYQGNHRDKSRRFLHFDHRTPNRHLRETYIHT